MNPGQLQEHIETSAIEEATFPQKIMNFEISPFKPFSRDQTETNFPRSKKNMFSSEFRLISEPEPLEINSCKSQPILAQSPIKNRRRRAQFQDEIPTILNSDEVLSASIKNKNGKSKTIKSRSFLGKMFLVRKFIKNLRENSSYRSIKWLKKLHFDVINDWAFFAEKRGISTNFLFSWFSSHFEATFMKNLANFFREFTRLAIHPTSTFRLLWDFFVIILTIYDFFAIPLKVAFDFGDHKDFDSGDLLTFLFLIDMVVNLNTAFYFKGELIESREMIVKNYFLKGNFFSDLASLTFPILHLLFDDSPFLLKLSSLLFILRLRNLSSSVCRFEEFLFSDERTNNIISFVRLIFSILLFSHWAASFYILLGKIETIGWMQIYHVSSSDFFTQYITSLYFIVVVLNTVGFGDMVANTISEKIFTIAFISISSIMFAYSINQIGTIIFNMNQNQRELKRNMTLINGYMKSKKIILDLKIKIKNYLEYIWQSEKLANNEETTKIINRLSKNLKNELLLHANGVILKDIPFLAHNFSEESLRKIVYEMKEVSMTPGDIVYNQNDAFEHNLYIIKNGEVALYIDSTRSKHEKPVFLKILTAGSYFGEYAFFSGFSQPTTAKSLSFSSLFMISQESFLRIMRESPEDYQKYCFIRDSINLRSNLDEIKRCCLSCENPEHLEIDCPKWHLVLSKERILKKHTFSVPQKRKEFQRKDKNRQFKAVVNQDSLSEIANKVAKKALKEQLSIMTGVENSLQYLDVESENSEMESPTSPRKPFKKLSFEIPDPILRSESKELKKENLNKSEDLSTHEKIKPKDEKRFSEGLFNHKSHKYISSNNLTTQIAEIERKRANYDQVSSYINYFPEHNIEVLIMKYRIYGLNRKLLAKKTLFSSMYPASSILIPSQSEKVSVMSGTVYRVKRKDRTSTGFFKEKHQTFQESEFKIKSRAKKAKKLKEKMKTMMEHVKKWTYKGMNKLKTSIQKRFSQRTNFQISHENDAFKLEQNK